MAEDTGALSTAWLVASVETSWEGATELGQALHFLLGVDKALPQEFAPRGWGATCTGAHRGPWFKQRPERALWNRWHRSKGLSMSSTRGLADARPWPLHARVLGAVLEGLRLPGLGVLVLAVPQFPHSPRGDGDVMVSEGVL